VALEHLYTHSIIGGQRAEGQFYHRPKTTAAHGLVPWAASPYIRKSLLAVDYGDRDGHFRRRVHLGYLGQLLAIIRRDRLEAGHRPEREQLPAERRRAGVLHAGLERAHHIVGVERPVPGRDDALRERRGLLDHPNHLKPAR